jgi:xanthine dehydrogenase YagR molybdenum-binding subunit
MSAIALLSNERPLTKEMIKELMSGNLCRCEGRRSPRRTDALSASASVVVGEASRLRKQRSSPTALLKSAGLPSLAREASGTTPRRRQNLSLYSFGAHFVEVHADEESGRLRVARVVSVFERGRILNPRTATSQIKGALVFGIGMALMEQPIYDPNTARVLTDDLADYQVPANLDVPPIDVLFVNEPDLQFNELGARGLGEIGLPGCAAAIASAVLSAKGRRFRDLPILPKELVS